MALANKLWMLVVVIQVGIIVLIMNSAPNCPSSRSPRSRRYIDEVLLALNNQSNQSILSIQETTPTQSTTPAPGQNVTSQRRHRQDATVIVVIPTAPREGDPVLHSAIESFIQANDGSAICLVFSTVPPGKHPVFERAKTLFQNDPNVWFLQFHDRKDSTARFPPTYDWSSEDVERAYQNPDTFLQNWDKPTHGIHTTDQHRKQTADFACALYYAAQVFPNTDVLLWEDDCDFCPGTFSMIVRFREVVGDDYAMIKMGFGGSGHLIESKIVNLVAEYVFAQIYWAFVDISIHRYLSFHRYPSYATVKTFSVHKGTVSTFSTKGRWQGKVSCDLPLDIYWGSFGNCTYQPLVDIGVRCVDRYVF